MPVTTLMVTALVIATLTVITPMPVAFGPVPPLFVGFMLVVPVIPVSLVMTIPDELLARPLSAETIELPAVFVEMQVGLRFIHHLFVTVIKIKITVTGRQFTGICPMPPVKINKLMIRYVIISLDIRNIIIFHVVIPGWSPGRLRSDVYRNPDLRLCRIDQGSRCKNHSRQ
jgi:hypothetical protein